MMTKATHREKILHRLKCNYKKAIGLLWNIKLPGKHGYHMAGNLVEIVFSDESVCSNIQTDDSAFEGWPLGIKYLGGFYSINHLYFLYLASP